ncbi:MAG: hypothetical protein RMK18_03340 [Armatimonadota bacterium]|nr:oligogalacturonate lyase family protein [Armatimonadota bacterium]MCX7777048.1 oligogalacturonate lyase family protein [Armatimonadota bacterium]MDW8024884.1 hypothetical protein [Armatimonadota bacterium]
MKRVIRWIEESIHRGTEPVSGSSIWQLTSAPVISHDIYGEQIYASTDGNRIAFLRSFYPHNKMPELWVCDLITKKVAMVSEAVGGFASSPFLDSLYFVRPVGNEHCLARLNLKTLEQDDVFTFTDCPLPISETISPDERYFVGAFRLQGNLYGLYRIDLERGTWEIFHEKEDIFNPHLQFEPSEGCEILVQWNRGGIVDEDGNIIRSVGDEGATLYVVDRDGKNFRSLPIGKPHTEPITGHECWVGDTKQVLLTAVDGTVYLVALGEERAKAIAKNSGFNHISASADGRFFVVDDFRNGWLYLGSVETKRCMPICDSRASCGCPQYTHTHPYITPNNRYIIFNSDETGICQVYAATIPDGFLENLEAA